MRIERTPSLVTAMAALAAVAAFGLFGQAPLVQARGVMTSSSPTFDDGFTYSVLPSETDDGAGCLGPHAPGIGCESSWGDLAINEPHYLYVPTSSPQSGKLLLFLCGGTGRAGFCENVFPVAASQGYHVIALTYPAGEPGDCLSDDDLTHEQKLDCFGDYVTENVTGRCPTLGSNRFPTLQFRPGCNKSSISDHPQDSVVNRLVKVLRWAHAYHWDHGWEQYLIGGTEIDWTKVHLAGHSNGSSHVSLMGTLYQDIGRVALFAGPNDGLGSTAEKWDPVHYVRLIEGVTDTRYYGLVHELNKADSPTDDKLFKVTENWRTFGMEGPVNPPRVEFDPAPGVTPDFGNAHMLVSTDVVFYYDAHNTVVKDVYCIDHKDPDENGDIRCETFDVYPIGYVPAWRCVLGTGNSLVNHRPVAISPPDQTLECAGKGGAPFVLDGADSQDADCDVLAYAWTGPFLRRAGDRSPTVFLPLGTHAFSLVVSDPWSSSRRPAMTEVTVVDTEPPTMRVSLTATTVGPPNNFLVRIDADVTASDSCGDAKAQVVLSSITSDQPSDTADIKGAEIGTFDRSFFVRAGQSGGDRIRPTYTVTYTATDANGNQTQRSATVQVPDQRR